jgi:hypothetical protein
MKSISALAIVSIIAILLAIGLIYIVVKPPSFLKTTTTSIMTSYIPTTEISISATTYIITTTYATTYTTLSTYPTTITQTITQTITFTIIPAEKIEIPWISFEDLTWYSGKISLRLHFYIINKNYSEIYIDPHRNVTIRGRGILNEHPRYQEWYVGTSDQTEPFTFSGSPSATLDFATNCNFYTMIDPDEYNAKEIKHGQVYTVSFDYRVIYINGTWSDWKTFTFNITYTGKDLG